VHKLLKPAGARDFVVFFVEHANGATILMCAEQRSLTERWVYAPCSPEEIDEHDPYAECETYSLSSHNKKDAKLLSDFVSSLLHRVARVHTMRSGHYRKLSSATPQVSDIKGLCESPNHEVFSTASKGLFEPQQDGSYVFELPLHVDKKDATEMPQEQYDARFFFCSLLAVVCAPTLH
jgi:hypothetical protein